MKDRDLTKEQLISELAELRRRVAELDAAKTEWEQVEKALRDSEERYRLIAENVTDVIWLADMDFHFTYVSPSVEPLRGYRVEEAMAQSLADVLTPASLVRAMEILEEEKENIERGAVQPQTVVLEFKCKDGSTVQTESTVSVLYGENRMPVGILGSTRDISERKRAEKALQESETRLRTLSDAAFEGISFTEQGIVIDLNRQFADMLGYEVNEMLGLDVRQFVAPEDREFVRERILSGSEEPYEHRALRKDGTAISVETRPRMMWIDGRPMRVTAVRDITERKRVEEALRESETRFRALSDATFEGIVFTRQGIIVDTNQQFADLLGYEIDEVRGLDVRQLIVPEDREFVWNKILTGSEEPHEHRTVHKDGSVIFVEVHPRMTSIEGRPVRVAAIRDITERKRTEEALRRERDKAQTYLDLAGVMMVALNEKGEITLINRKGCQILGYNKENELIGRNWFDTCVPPHIREGVRSVFDRLMAGQVEPVEFYENPVLTSSGEERIIAWHNAVLTDDAGNVTGTLSSGEDITERKQAEEERERLLAQIRAQARRMAQILDTVPEGVLLLDADERIILVNPVAEGELAFLSDARIGDILIQLGDRPLTEVLTTPPQGLWHEVVVDGRIFQVIARPIEDGSTTSGWVLVIRDVTQQREVQQRIEQQERLAAVGQLAAGIAHDFNNIMATVVLYAQMTARMEGLPANVQDRMRTIYGQAKHATNLIQQILDFSRRSVLERRPLDLIPLLKEHVRLLRRTLPESVEITFDCRPDEQTTPFVVNADPTRMQQMVTNLALNARDAMPRGGELRIRLERIEIKPGESPLLPEMDAGEWVQMTVSDTGMGIPPDVLPHIFEPFFTTRAPLGSGLGLAQVHGIVGQHGGKIDVETRVGKGTTFTIYLPAHQSELSSVLSRTELPALPMGQGETILVVEDNAVVRRALAEGLELLNYRVLEVSNGQEALETLEEQRGEIALVLSDVVMPRMSGIALLHALRERGLTEPMVMLTGHPVRREMEELRAKGMVDWLPKPPELEQLAETVARALGTGFEPG